DQGRNGRPFLFVWTDPDWTVGPDGPYNTIPDGQTRGDTLIAERGFIMPQCPACLKTRDLANESEAERLQYGNWVELYVLPEAKAMADALSREHKQHYENKRRRGAH
ncbi:MAG: hypothetical protein MI757_03720, partial [Pirellulales bacterium]|nr:hypothetical protein [Pirellulales bacterium]